MKMLLFTCPRFKQSCHAVADGELKIPPSNCISHCESCGGTLNSSINDKTNTLISGLMVQAGFVKGLHTSIACCNDPTGSVSAERGSV